MKQSRLAPIALLLTAFSGCGKHIPESTTAPPDVPRIGWIIMTGGRDNPDDVYVCQSEPRTEECALPASSADHNVFADVHFYFHPAAADTRYTGTIELGFIQGGHPLTPNATVKAADKPAQATVLGMVSSVPGAHSMNIALVAEGQQRREINEQVVVQVRAPQVSPVNLLPSLNGIW